MLLSLGIPEGIRAAKVAGVAGRAGIVDNGGGSLRNARLTRRRRDAENTNASEPGMDTDAKPPRGLYYLCVSAPRRETQAA